MKGNSSIKQYDKGNIHCCCGKAISITYCECLLVIQRLKFIRRIILSSVSCLTLYHIYFFSHQRHDLLQTVTENKMCFNFLCNFLCEIFLVLDIIQRDIIINVHRSSCKVPVILVGF